MIQYFQTCFCDDESTSVGYQSSKRLPGKVLTSYCSDRCPNHGQDMACAANKSGKVSESRDAVKHRAYAIVFSI